jgi:Mycothiol maleylpyruvate isomerase N-terminal domain
MARVSPITMYGEVLDAFVAGLEAADPDAPIPACPAWTASELLAHQVHQLAGMCDGSFPGHAAIDALTAPSGRARQAALQRQQSWIDRGVAVRSAHTVKALIAEWSALVEHAPVAALEGILPDAVVHLFDLLGLTGRTTHRHLPFVAHALEFWGQMTDLRLRAAGYSGLRLQLADDHSLGAPDAEVVIAGTTFELLRTITGRRSRPQARALQLLSGDQAALDHLALYGWRATALDEGQGSDVA